MSLGPARAETTAPSPDNPSLLARIAGVVLRPRSTFAAVVMRPRSAGVLAMLTAVTFAATAGFLATDVGQVALVDQWERTALAFGRPVDDARYADMQELSRYRVPYAAALSVARGPVAAVAIAGVLYGLFAMRGRRARFGQVLAVVAHAGVILTLRDVVAAPLNYVRESLASPLDARAVLRDAGRGVAAGAILRPGRRVHAVVDRGARGRPGGAVPGTRACGCGWRNRRRTPESRSLLPAPWPFSVEAADRTTHD